MARGDDAPINKSYLQMPKIHKNYTKSYTSHVPKRNKTNKQIFEVFWIHLDSFAQIAFPFWYLIFNILNPV